MSVDIADVAETANEAIAQHIDAGKSYATWLGKELEIRAARDARHAEIVEALVGQTNPLTNKAHSATSAKAAADADAGILEMEAELVRLAVSKSLALTYQQSAKLRAELSIALINAKALEEVA